MERSDCYGQETNAKIFLSMSKEQQDREKQKKEFTDFVSLCANMCYVSENIKEQIRTKAMLLNPFIWLSEDIAKELSKSFAIINTEIENKFPPQERYNGALIKKFHQLFLDELMFSDKMLESNILNQITFVRNKVIRFIEIER